MSQNIEFNEDERDCIQELMNVAYGSGAAAVSEILGAFATLNIPNIKTIPASGLKPYLEEKLNIDDELFIATQLLSGELSGENLFIINHASTINLAHEFDLADDEINDNELFDIVLEITNILSSSTIGTFAKGLNTVISFEPPTVQKLKSISKFDNVSLKNYNQIIIISTELTFNDQKIDAELLMLTKDESIIWLKSALNKILDEF